MRSRDPRDATKNLARTIAQQPLELFVPWCFANQQWSSKGDEFCSVCLGHIPKRQSRSGSKALSKSQHFRVSVKTRSLTLSYRQAIFHGFSRISDNHNRAIDRSDDLPIAF